jgi:hypothetical protein
MSAPRIQFDAAETGVAFGADYVAFSHGGQTMSDDGDRSKTNALHKKAH